MGATHLMTPSLDLCRAICPTRQASGCAVANEAQGQGRLSARFRMTLKYWHSAQRTACALVKAACVVGVKRAAQLGDGRALLADGPVPERRRHRLVTGQGVTCACPQRKLS